MPNQLELHDDVLEWEIGGVNTDEISQKEIQAIDAALRSWRIRTALDTFEFIQTAPLVFSYEVKHTDLREVTGSIDFNADVDDPTVTIDQPDPWAITEILRIDTKSAIINAVKELGMTSLVVNFF